MKRTLKAVRGWWILLFAVGLPVAMAGGPESAAVGTVRIGSDMGQTPLFGAEARFGAPPVSRTSAAPGKSSGTAGVGGGFIVWNTFLGSDDGNTTDIGEGIAVDDSGNVYVVGRCDGTWGSPVRPYEGGVDAFVAQMIAIMAGQGR